LTQLERFRAIFSPVFWRTIPKAIALSGAASLSALLAKALVLDQFPAPFRWMNAAGDVVTGLLGSVVASVVFYLIATHYDEVRLKKVYGPQIALWLQTVWTAFGTMLFNLEMKTAMAQDGHSDSNGQYFYDLNSNLSQTDFANLLACSGGAATGSIFSIACITRLKTEMGVYFNRCEAMHLHFKNSDVLNRYVDDALREKLLECYRLRGILQALISGNHTGGTRETLASYMYHYYTACLDLRTYSRNHPFYGI
jgi:hypothetical protein